MQLGGAVHLAVLDIADDGGALREAARGVGSEEDVVGDAVEAVAARLRVKPQQMLAERREVRRPELTDDAGRRDPAFHGGLLVVPPASRRDGPNIVQRTMKFKVNSQA